MASPPIWTPASLGRYQNLWKYRTVSHLAVGGQVFTILEVYKESPWHEHGCNMGFEQFIDGHFVPEYIFDRALGLAKKAA